MNPSHTIPIGYCFYYNKTKNIAIGKGFAFSKPNENPGDVDPWKTP